MKIWAYVRNNYYNEYCANVYAGTDNFEDVKNVSFLGATEVEAKDKLIKGLPEDTEIIWFDSSKDFREGDYVIFDNKPYVFSAYMEGKVRIIAWYIHKVILVDCEKVFMYYPKRLW